MGTDPCPWDRWQSLPWQSVNSNYDGNVDLQSSALSNPRPIAAFPSYANGFGVGFYGNAPTAVAAPMSIQRSSVIRPHLDPMIAPPEAATTAAAERRFLIFDQSGNETSILFSSVGPPFWNLNHSSPKPGLLDKYGTAGRDMPGNYAPVNLSGGTEVSDGTECEEMREDTDEIDALLYSDSEFEEDANADAEDEQGPTGLLLPQGPTASAEEVASNSVLSPPAKRRRLTEEEAIDTSLMDTASSAKAQKAWEDSVGNKGGSDDESSSCVGGTVEVQERPRTGAGRGMKRARIQETLCVLRKIIPRGKGKDDGAVLDEAIRYLRSLKLKAKALGNKLK